MDNIVISVLVPVYNVGDYVEQCLRSIMSQTFTKGVECIICDDCSSDNSLEIIDVITQEYIGDINFKVIRHTNNRGIAAARNSLLDAAQGIYLLYVDSDDYLEPNMLAFMYSEARRTSADIVGCNFFRDFGYKKIEDSAFKYRDGMKNEDYLREIIKDHYPYLWRRLVRRELYLKNNIRYIEGVNLGEDFMTIVPLHYYSRICAYVDKPLYNYRLNANSIIMSHRTLEKYKELVSATQSVEQFLKTKEVLEKYKISFYKRCFSLKSFNIVSKKYRNYERWKNTFCESNNYVDQYFESAIKRFYWKSLLNAPTAVRPIWYLMMDLATFKREVTHLLTRQSK